MLKVAPRCAALEPSSIKYVVRDGNDFPGILVDQQGVASDPYPDCAPGRGRQVILLEIHEPIVARPEGGGEEFAERPAMAVPAGWTAIIGDIEAARRVEGAMIIAEAAEIPARPAIASKIARLVNGSPAGRRPDQVKDRTKDLTGTGPTGIGMAAPIIAVAAMADRAAISADSAIIIAPLTRPAVSISPPIAVPRAGTAIAGRLANSCPPPSGCATIGS